MDAIGHPMVGDSIYIKEDQPSAAVEAPRQRLHLHAHKISFVHPIDGQRIDITAPCPFS